MLGLRPGSRAVGARRSLLSGRGVVLIVISVTAVILLALPLREYLRQQGEIAEAEAKVAAQQQRVDDLQHRVELWQDEDYVRSQARQRLSFLLPGEVGYRVLMPGEEDNGALGAAPPKSEPQKGAWYTKLWNSVRAADRETPESEVLR